MTKIQTHRTNLASQIGMNIARLLGLLPDESWQDNCKTLKMDIVIKMIYDNRHRDG